MKSTVTSIETPSFCRTLTPLVGLAVALASPGPAVARETQQREARIAECIRQVSGGRPWLEKTLWGLRDQEGGWIGAQVRNTNGSHDLGPLQINTWWVPKVAAMVGRSEKDVRHWLTSDPCFNAGAARWIFLSALRSTGSYWQAIGIYHSPTAWRQQRYALSVGRHLQRRFGNDIFVRQSPDARALSQTADSEQFRQVTAISDRASYRGFGFGRVIDWPHSIFMKNIAYVEETVR